jgi:hypothetical protein
VIKKQSCYCQRKNTIDGIESLKLTEGQLTDIFVIRDESDGQYLYEIGFDIIDSADSTIMTTIVNEMKKSFKFIKSLS